MIKKILFGIVIAGITGVLIFGGVNRTMAQSSKAEPLANSLLQQREESRLNIREELLEQKNLGTGLGNGGVGLGKGMEGTDPNATGNGNGHGAGDEDRVRLNDGTPDGDGVPNAAVGEWIVIEGVVTAMDADTLQVTTSDGQVILVENRAWWYAQELGTDLKIGDAVSLVGFYEDADFQAGIITNLNSGQSVSLRNESGQPLWSGKENVGGKGGGN